MGYNSFILEIIEYLKQNSKGKANVEEMARNFKIDINTLLFRLSCYSDKHAFCLDDEHISLLPTHSNLVIQLRSQEKFQNLNSGKIDIDNFPIRIIEEFNLDGGNTTPLNQLDQTLEPSNPIPVIERLNSLFLFARKIKLSQLISFLSSLNIEISDLNRFLDEHFKDRIEFQSRYVIVKENFNSIPKWEGLQ